MKDELLSWEEFKKMIGKEPSHEEYQKEMERIAESIVEFKKEEEELIKTYRALLAPVMHTPDKVRALKNLRTASANGLLPKLQFLSDFYTLVERGIVDQEAISSRPALYVASGVDVELPLLMGVRDLQMIDPLYLNKIFQKIKEYQGRKIEKHRFCLNFDFGDGTREVIIQRCQKHLENVVLEKKYGLILEFASPPGFSGLDAYLLEGGYHMGQKRDGIKNTIGTERCLVYQNKG